MKTFNITVQGRVASYVQREGVLICDNGDYKVRFTFDAEWSDRADKTARFIWNDSYVDVPITADECTVPVIQGADIVYVGVYSGELITTTPATIRCRGSIKGKSGTAHDSQVEVYRDRAEEAALRAEAAATEVAEAVQKVEGAEAEALRAEAAAFRAEAAADKVSEDAEKVAAEAAAKAAEQAVKAAEDAAQRAEEAAAEAEEADATFLKKVAPKDGLSRVYGIRAKSDSNESATNGAGQEEVIVAGSVSGTENYRTIPRREAVKSSNSTHPGTFDVWYPRLPNTPSELTDEERAMIEEIENSPYPYNGSPKHPIPIGMAEHRYAKKSDLEKVKAPSTGWTSKNADKYEKVFCSLPEEILVEAVTAGEDCIKYMSSLCHLVKIQDSETSVYYKGGITLHKYDPDLYMCFTDVGKLVASIIINDGIPELCDISFEGFEMHCTQNIEGQVGACRETSYGFSDIKVVAYKGTPLPDPAYTLTLICYSEEELEGPGGSPDDIQYSVNGGEFKNCIGTIVEENVRTVTFRNRWGYQAEMVDTTDQDPVLSLGSLTSYTMTEDTTLVLSISY